MISLIEYRTDRVTHGQTDGQTDKQIDMMYLRQIMIITMIPKLMDSLSQYEGFQKWGCPQNGWFFLRGNPIKSDDLGVPPFQETSIYPPSRPQVDGEDMGRCRAVLLDTNRRWVLATGKGPNDGKISSNIDQVLS